MKGRYVIVALFLILIATLTATAAISYTAGDSYADGSWRYYSVYTEGQDDSPPDAPCRGIIYYGPAECTTSANCMARAAALPSTHRCYPQPGGPIYP